MRWNKLMKRGNHERHVTSGGKRPDFGRAKWVILCAAEKLHTSVLFGSGPVPRGIKVEDANSSEKVGA
jgi:hypothetical protein